MSNHWRCPMCGLEFDQQPQPDDCPACYSRLVEESHYDGMTSKDSDNGRPERQA